MFSLQKVYGYKIYIYVRTVILSHLIHLRHILFHRYIFKYIQWLCRIGTDYYIYAFLFTFLAFEWVLFFIIKIWTFKASADFNIYMCLLKKIIRETRSNLRPFSAKPENGKHAMHTNQQKHPNWKLSWKANRSPLHAAESLYFSGKIIFDSLANFSVL